MNGVRCVELGACGADAEEKGHEGDVVVSGDDTCHLP
jgi:hypothetical protein